MEFPVYLTLGPLALHPHWVFEGLAYFLGSRVYLWLKARQGDPIAAADRWSIVAAAAVGAAIGSKLLYWLSDPALTLERWQDPYHLMGGKSVVGGLIGGLVAVEWVKRRIGLTRSTGDLFAIPLAVGIAIGRMGCFLTGLDDHTHGLPTSLPWGVDFGDGLTRHPAQLYEIAFLALLTPALVYLRARPHHEGDLFKVFMVAYMGFRLLLEFIKPGVALAGLNPIQWACVAMLLYYGWQAPSAFRLKEVPGG
jgi:phosphatidylglycerol:prolipoprotein diacylglycerol transferase